MFASWLASEKMPRSHLGDKLVPLCEVTEQYIIGLGMLWLCLRMANLGNWSSPVLLNNEQGDNPHGGEVRIWSCNQNSQERQSLGQPIPKVVTDNIRPESVALSADGITLVAGESNFRYSTGRVLARVYYESSSSWDALGQVLEGDGVEGYFGWLVGGSIDLSADGRTLAVGISQ